MAQTREELLADRAALVAARTALLTGQQVKEYWRDGRRVVYQGSTPDALKAAIADIDVLVAGIDAAGANTPRPRYRALSVRFGGCR